MMTDRVLHRSCCLFVTSLLLRPLGLTGHMLWKTRRTFMISPLNQLVLVQTTGSLLHRGEKERRRGEEDEEEGNTDVKQWSLHFPWCKSYLCIYSTPTFPLFVALVLKIHIIVSAYTVLSTAPPLSAVSEQSLSNASFFISTGWHQPADALSECKP